jgi:hypothetical protein
MRLKVILNFPSVSTERFAANKFPYQNSFIGPISSHTRQISIPQQPPWFNVLEITFTTVYYVSESNLCIKIHRCKLERLLAEADCPARGQPKRQLKDNQSPLLRSAIPGTKRIVVLWYEELKWELCLSWRISRLGRRPWSGHAEALFVLDWRRLDAFRILWWMMSTLEGGDAEKTWRLFGISAHTPWLFNYISLHRVCIVV